ncbi:FkbM family methyltransferase [Mycobacterium marseillense]|uniref:FkbM family methyltransferase n=1 Tax=Mycobacterium marseillense TaxID=701042 RepID=UPI0015D19B07|nr:FkbM family methyltransferase [Mycobacterium marseillense]
MQFLDQAAATIDAFRLRALNRQGKPLRVKVDGNTYYLNPESTALYHARQSMPKLVRMVELIGDATTIFDVGANCGIFAALCARKFPTATIHVFEPAKTLQSILALNCSAPNISVHELAVGDQNDLLTLYVHPDSQQANSLRLSAVEPFLHGTEFKTETIRCVTLDSFAAEHGVPPIDVLKVDVQGLEGAVLRGAQSSLKSVQYLFLEVTWLDLEGVQRILPAAEHYGFRYVAVVNEVYTGADLLFTREPLNAKVPNVLRFPLGAESAGQPWF